MKGFRNINRLRRIVLWTVAAMAATAVPGAGFAQTPADVGMVLSASGQANYTNPADKDGPEPVQAFMKIRAGDRIDLSDGGRIELMFVESGRRETWRGPARLTVGRTGAVSADPNAAPEVAAVQSAVANAIGASGLPLPRGRIARSGVNLVRGTAGECPEPPPIPRRVSPLTPSDRAELASARRIYEDLRRQVPAADPLPDLYLLSVLARYEQFGEMAVIVDRLRQVHGAIPAVVKWGAWIRENYPVRLSFFLLTPDDACRRGPACFSLGDMGYFRKSGPCPASELPEKAVRTGDILTFALTNTSDAAVYCALVNIDAAGKTERLFPEAAGSPETARLEAGKTLDLFSDAGIGLMPEKPGRETIRVYLSPEPFSGSALSGIKEGATDGMETIDAILHVSQGPS
jgi:hypothetical protein